MKKDKTYILLFLLILIALIYRLFLIFHSPFALFSDDAIYAQLARFWIKGDYSKVFHPTWPPLYPFLSATVYLLLRNWELSLRFVSALAGAFLVLPIYYLLKNVTTKLNALVFCSFFIFFEPFIGSSVMPLSDSLSVFFTISAICVSYLGISEKKYYYILLASLLFGLNYLTRPEGFLFFVLTLSFYFLFFLCTKSSRQLKNFILLLVSLFIFLATISPYIIFLRIKTGFWSLSYKAAAQLKQDHAFLIRENGLTWSQEAVSVKNPNYSSDYFRGGGSNILNSGLLWIWFKEKPAKWLIVFEQYFQVWSIPFIFLGLFYLFRKNLWETGYLLYLLSVAIPLTIFITPITDPRYLMWTFPIIWMFFVKGGLQILKLIPLNTKVVKNLVLVSLVLMVISSPSLNKKHLLTPKKYAALIKQQNDSVEIRIVSDWISKNSKTNNVKIMSRHEGFEFYLDGETIYIPQDKTYEEVVEYGKKQGAQFLIIWERQVGFEEDLKKLLDIKANSDKPIVFYYPKDKPKIVVYSIE